jgi:hypothetical protein
VVASPASRTRKPGRVPPPPPSLQTFLLQLTPSPSTFLIICLFRLGRASNGKSGSLHQQPAVRVIKLRRQAAAQPPSELRLDSTRACLSAWWPASTPLASSSSGAVRGPWPLPRLRVSTAIGGPCLRCHVHSHQPPRFELGPCTAWGLRRVTGITPNKDPHTRMKPWARGVIIGQRPRRLFFIARYKRAGACVCGRWEVAATHTHMAIVNS